MENNLSIRYENNTGHNGPENCFTSRDAYCLCSTDGRLVSSIIFSDRDRIEWKNRAALTALFCGIVVVVYSIMPNHVHFVLRGSREQCAKFITILIRQMMRYYRRNGTRLEGKIVGGVREILDDEHLRNATAYTLRNHLSAGNYSGMLSHSNLRICLSPSEKVAPPKNSRSVSEIGVKERRRMLKSGKIPPGDWCIKANGEIWDGSFTDFNSAKKFFGNMGFFLSSLGISKNNTKIDMLVAESFVKGRNHSLSDGELRIEAEAIAYEKYGVHNLNAISFNDLCHVLAKLSHLRGTSAKRLSRIFHLNEYFLKAIIKETLSQ